MLWIGKAFQSSHAGLPVLLEIFANGKHHGLVRPKPKALPQRQFSVGSRTPADWGLELSSAFCACWLAEINEKAWPGRYGPEGLVISAGSASCLNTGEILPEVLPYVVRHSLLQEVSRTRGWAQVRKVPPNLGRAGQPAIIKKCREPQLPTCELGTVSGRIGLPRELRVGQTLGHYRLVEQISTGGMGVVYRAHDEHLDREVAVKVLASASVNDAAACRRFQNEALILSKLNHPNIISIYDFDAQDGIDFLVMEYVPGQTLSARLERGPLTQDEVLHIGRQIAASVKEAHDHGIIHRDLKPQNVLLTPKGQVKVADFGLAKLASPVIDPAATTNVSRDLGLIGTLPYMPPEQLRGKPTDFRSDIYSAGAVLYELATGRRAFPETLGPRLIDSILHEVPHPPSSLTRWVSEAFETIVLKCLEKEPERRYQSSAELGVDLQHLSTSTASLPAEIENNAKSKAEVCGETLAQKYMFVNNATSDSTCRVRSII